MDRFDDFFMVRFDDFFMDRFDDFLVLRDERLVTFFEDLDTIVRRGEPKEFRYLYATDILFIVFNKMIFLIILSHYIIHHT